MGLSGVTECLGGLMGPGGVTGLTAARRPARAGSLDRPGRRTRLMTAPAPGQQRMASADSLV